MNGCIYKRDDGRCDKPGKYMAFCIGEACEHQTPSNYDLLISKTPEEMAVFMHDMFLISTEIGLSTEWWLQWLKSPVEPGEVDK